MDLNRKSLTSIGSSGMSFPDPATATNADTSGEMDRWKNPTGDLVPLLKLSRDCRVAIKDPTGSA
jgi:hypothetical protein